MTMYDLEFQRVAQNILSDRYAADYYKDEKLLTRYLEASFDVPYGHAQNTAKAILEDRRGANYYQDAKSMSSFLQEQFARVPEGNI